MTGLDKGGILPIPSGTSSAFAGVLEARARGPEVVGPVQFFEDPYFLGRRTNPRRFANQRIILKVFYGEDLEEWEKEWLRDLYKDGRTNFDVDRDMGINFLILLLEVGQRSGKSFLGAGISLYEYYRWIQYENPQTEVLMERGKEPIGIGSPVEIKMVATSKENAKDHVFNELQNFIYYSPWAQDHFDVDKDLGNLFVRGRKNCSIRAGACTARGIRGGTGISVLLDELSWMVDTKGNVGGKEIYRAMRNTTKTTDGKIIAISSPRTDDDQLVSLGRLAKARVLERSLWFNLPSWLMDPSLSMDDFEQEHRTDPEGWDRDFNAHASAALEPYFRMPSLVSKFLGRIPHPGGFVAPEVGISYDLEREFHQVVREYIIDDHPVDKKSEYQLWGDPAEKNDAFGYVLGHTKPSGQIIIDLMGRFLADPQRGKEIDAFEVRAFFTAVVDKFGVITYGDDAWGYQETRQAIRDHGAEVKDVKVDIARGKAAKEAIYEELEPIPVLCYDLPIVRRELLSIELVNGKKIEFPKKEGEMGHGDIAYALINFIAEAYEPRRRHGDLGLA